MRKRPKRKGLRLYFVPHAHNDYHPHLLGLSAVVVVILVAISLPFVVGNGIKMAVEMQGQSAAVVSASLYELANSDRSFNGKKPLTFSSTLAYAAQLKAEDMARRQYFAHKDPDGNDPWMWFDKVDYVYENAGENLAIDFSESRDVEIAWMNSEKHRENILKKDYTEMGVGIADGIYEGHPTTYVVQFFGKPKTIAVNLSEAAPDPEVAVAEEAPAPVAKKKESETVAATSALETTAVAVESVATGTVLGTGTGTEMTDRSTNALSAPTEIPASFLGGWMGMIALALASPSYLLLGIYAVLLVIFVGIAIQLFGRHHLFIRREAYLGAGLVIVVLVILLYLAYTPSAVGLA